MPVTVFKTNCGVVLLCLRPKATRQLDAVGHLKKTSNPLKFTGLKSAFAYDALGNAIFPMCLAAGTEAQQEGRP